MEELTYRIEIIEPFEVNMRFGKPFYNFSIDIIKIKYYVDEEEEYKSLFYNG
jgi:hypothetical protein